MDFGALLNTPVKPQTRPVVAESSLYLEQIPLAKLTPFPNQPFKPYTDQQLEELAHSIESIGLLSPILTRPFENGYQIVAGHNRVNATLLLGEGEIAATVRDMSDEEAVIALVESNLSSRKNISHSEKAKAYKLEYEARKRQGQALGTLCPKLRTSKEMASSTEEGEKRIRQYVKLAELLPILLELLDREKLPFLSAYYLAFLSHEKQQLVYAFMETQHRSIDIALAEKIKALGEDVTEEALQAIATPVALEKPLKTLRIKYKVVKQYFKNGEDEKTIEETILKALEQYFKGGQGEQ